MKTVNGAPPVTLAGAASGATARLAKLSLLEDDAVILKQEKHIQVLNSCWRAWRKFPGR